MGIARALRGSGIYTGGFQITADGTTKTMTTTQAGDGYAAGSIALLSQPLPLVDGGAVSQLKKLSNGRWYTNPGNAQSFATLDEARSRGAVIGQVIPAAVAGTAPPPPPPAPNPPPTQAPQPQPAPVETLPPGITDPVKAAQQTPAPAGASAGLGGLLLAGLGAVALAKLFKLF